MAEGRRRYIDSKFEDSGAKDGKVKQRRVAVVVIG